MVGIIKIRGREMRVAVWIGISVLINLLVGCAHRIDVKPNMADLVQVKTSDNKIDAVVGYYIPSNLLSLEVTTPGGGGDNVKYKPYQDMETGYKLVLSRIYKDVQKVQSNGSLDQTNQNVDYVFEPTVVTSSGSTGFFTWPPTNFSVDLTSNIRDRSGVIISSPRVVGVGVASTSERIKVHGIAGKRAMTDALTKFQNQLNEIKLPSKNNVFADTTNQQTQQTQQTQQETIPVLTSSVEKRLQDLDGLRKKRVINETEYKKMREKILNEF